MTAWPDREATLQGVTAAYVHVPFCRHRCGYCNFSVVAGRDDLIASYLRAMEIELSALGKPRPVHTLFLGGGTPTHLPIEPLRSLLELVLRWFPCDPAGEFSVEANPEDIDEEKVDVLVEAGVNRISLGMQSFDLAKLRILERSHDVATAAHCWRLLRPRIPSLSLDLIFGAPHESLATWQADLATAIQFAPDHVSTYGLTYERGTRFYARKQKQELLPLPEDTERAMYEGAIETLTHHEYQHYEVSNFARPGHTCRHNENYWLCGEYFGIGPGAASYLGGVRRANHRSTTAYLKAILQGRSAVVETEPLDDKEQAHERLVFGLRRLEGIDLEDFAESTGFRVEELVGDNLHQLCDQGLLSHQQNRLRLTREGLLVSDSIWPYLL